MQINEFIKKLQNLSEQKKKIILWTSIAILTLFLLNWYLKNAKEILGPPRVEKPFEEQLRIPEIQEKMEETFQQIKPKEEEIREIEESFRNLIREAEEQMEKEKMEKQGKDIKPEQ